MKRKFFAGLLVMVLSLTLTMSTALAAIVEYDAAETVDWGQNGGGDANEFKFKLQEQGLDAAVVATITSIEFTFELETELFKPQLVINSEKGGWNQKEVEFAEVGTVVYTLDSTGKFTEDSNWNEVWIQSGWKSEGAASLVALTFKDASGNVVFSVGGDAAPVEEAPAETTDSKPAPKPSVPKTGVVDMSLVYGLGALASAVVVLKKKNR